MENKEHNGQAPARGRFIVLEGIDGAGKTTQLTLLRRHLEEQGHVVFCTAEPTGSPTGQLLRRALSGEIQCDVCEMAALFAADRVAHNTDAHDGITAHLNAGEDVLCDRYDYSSMAYQGSLTDFAWVRDMNLRCPAIRRPDLCLFFDLTPEQSLQRIGARGAAREIYEERSVLEAIRETFHQVLREMRATDRIEIIDASRGKDEIAADVAALVDRLQPRTDGITV